MADKTNTKLLTQVKKLETELAKLRRLLEQQPSTLAPPRESLSAVIRDRLRRAAGVEELDSLAAGLLSEGHDLGKYPRRSIKQAIRSPHVRSAFRSEKKTDKRTGRVIEVVQLIDK